MNALEEIGKEAADLVEAEIRRQVNERRELRSRMVGRFYPGVLAEQEYELLSSISDAREAARLSVGGL